MDSKINDQKILANVESRPLGQSVEKRVYISCRQIVKGKQREKEGNPKKEVK